MTKTKQYRYVERSFETETDFNIHIKEMIQMLKYEKVKENIYVKNVKLSTHGYERFAERIDGSMTLNEATRFVRKELKDAKRVGLITSYHGRLSVLYAKDQIGYYLSPDLKTLVTVSKCKEVTYEPIKQLMLNKVLTKEELIQLHMGALEKVEEIEQRQVKQLLKVESDFTETKRICSDLIRNADKHWKKQGYKDAIRTLSYNLKLEGRKLFKISFEKRQILRSLTSLL